MEKKYQSFVFFRHANLRMIDNNESILYFRNYKIFIHLNETATIIVQSFIVDCNIEKSANKICKVFDVNYEQAFNDVNNFLFHIQRLYDEKSNSINFDNQKFISILQKPLSVYLEITNSCNLNCIHCRVPKTNANNIFDNKIYSRIDKLSKEGVFEVSLTGGEPFNREDIFKIAEHCFNKNLGINILTNGTKITNDVIDWGKKFLINFYISLDGMPKTHNIIRGQECGNKILTMIKRLKENEIAIEVSTTLLKMNYHSIKKLCIFLNKYNINLKVRRFILNNEKDTILLAPIEQYYSFEKHNNNKLKFPNKSCTAANTSCYIDYKGDVYPCAFLKTPEFYSGNIDNDSFFEIWNSTVFNQIRNNVFHSCDTCSYYKKNECIGSCHAMSFFLYNRERPDIYCKKIYYAKK